MILRHRHTIRLLKHNYSAPQTYSITIGAYHHYQLFGQIKNKIFIPSDIGTVINHTLISLPIHHHCQLITYQLMPNHLHFIIKILKPDIMAQPAAPYISTPAPYISTPAPYISIPAPYISTPESFFKSNPLKKHLFAKILP